MTKLLDATPIVCATPRGPPIDQPYGGIPVAIDKVAGTYKDISDLLNLNLAAGDNIVTMALPTPTMMNVSYPLPDAMQFYRFRKIVLRLDVSCPTAAFGAWALCEVFEPNFAECGLGKDATCFPHVLFTGQESAAICMEIPWQAPTPVLPVGTTMTTVRLTPIVAPLTPGGTPICSARLYARFEGLEFFNPTNATWATKPKPKTAAPSARPEPRRRVARGKERATPADWSDLGPGSDSEAQSGSEECKAPPMHVFNHDLALVSDKGLTLGNDVADCTFEELLRVPVHVMSLELTAGDGHTATMIFRPHMEEGGYQNFWLLSGVTNMNVSEVLKKGAWTLLPLFQLWRGDMIVTLRYTRNSTDTQPLTGQATFPHGFDTWWGPDTPFCMGTPGETVSFRAPYRNTGTYSSMFTPDAIWPLGIAFLFNACVGAHIHVYISAADNFTLGQPRSGTPFQIYVPEDKARRRDRGGKSRAEAGDEEIAAKLSGQEDAKGPPPQGFAKTVVHAAAGAAIDAAFGAAAPVVKTLAALTLGKPDVELRPQPMRLKREQGFTHFDTIQEAFFGSLNSARGVDPRANVMGTRAGFPATGHKLSDLARMPMVSRTITVTSIGTLVRFPANPIVWATSLVAGRAQVNNASVIAHQFRYLRGYSCWEIMFLAGFLYQGAVEVTYFPGLSVDDLGIALPHEIAYCPAIQSSVIGTTRMRIAVPYIGPTYWAPSVSASDSDDTWGSIQIKFLTGSYGTEPISATAPVVIVLSQWMERAEFSLWDAKDCLFGET